MNIAEWIFLSVLGIVLFRSKALTLRSVDFKYLKVTGLLSGAFLLSSVVYVLHPLMIDGHVAESQFLRVLLKQIYFFLPIALTLGLREASEDHLKKVGTIALMVFGLLSIIAIQQHWSGWPFHQSIPGIEGKFHSTGFLNHHLSIVSIWIFPAFFILDCGNGLKNRFLALLGFIVIALAYSRMAWIATLLGVLIYIFLKSSSTKQKLRYLFVFFLVSGSSLLLPGVQSRIHQTMGVFDRIDLWKVHWQLFLARPLTGVGLLESQEYSGLLQIAQGVRQDVFAGHAHNVVLEILSSSGVIGFIAFLTWVVWITKKYITQLKTPGVTGLFTAWIVFLLNGLTQVNFFEGKVMHQVAWSTGVLLFLTSRREKG